MDTVGLLRALSEASGVSGHEASVRDIVRAALEPGADDVHVDALGNLIALRRGTRGDAPARSVMIAAHMDEIGLMVTGLEKGFLRVTRVGGSDPRVLLGQEVTVLGRRQLRGVVGSRPPHVLPPESRTKVVPIKDLFVDVGLSEVELAQVVRVGDLVAPYRPFTELAEGYASGKALDDRAGVTAMALCLEELRSLKHTWDVNAVATTQEEVGLRGASASAYGVNPDVAIAVDVGFGKQKGVKPDETVDLDAGPALAMGPNVHPAMYEGLMETAKRYEIKVQTEVIAGGSGTDGWAIQVARQGVPTAVISIPLRYMHSAVETVCIADIERTGRLMARFIASLDEAFAARLGL